MPRAKTSYKDIACLESIWDTRLDDRLSVQPIVRLAGQLNRLRVAHFTCNTEAEFRYNVGLLRRKRGYGILYLAFHGRPGVIQLPEIDISLDALAHLLGRGFANW